MTTQGTASGHVARLHVEHQPPRRVIIRQRAVRTRAAHAGQFDRQGVRLRNGLRVTVADRRARPQHLKERHGPRHVCPVQGDEVGEQVRGQPLREVRQGRRKKEGDLWRPENS